MQDCPVTRKTKLAAYAYIALSVATPRWPPVGGPVPAGRGTSPSRSSCPRWPPRSRRQRRTPTRGTGGWSTGRGRDKSCRGVETSPSSAGARAPSWPGSGRSSPPTSPTSPASPARRTGNSRSSTRGAERRPGSGWRSAPPSPWPPAARIRSSEHRSRPTGECSPPWPPHLRCSIARSRSAPGGPSSPAPLPLPRLRRHPGRPSLSPQPRKPGPRRRRHVHLHHGPRPHRSRCRRSSRYQRIVITL